jgi:group I intron endonuclease
MRTPHPTKIYLITCAVDGKVYVGKTVRPVQIRWIQHKSAANRGENTYLYRAMRHHGVGNFSIQEVEEAYTDDFGCELEKMFIRWHDSTNSEKGYNLTFGGDGVPATPETRKKISDTHKRLGTKGPGRETRHYSEEWRANVSKGRKGIPSWNKGKKLSPEHVEKLKSAVRPKGVTGRKPKDLPVDKIILLYDNGNGLNCREIGKILGVTKDSITRRLKKAGVVLRPVGFQKRTTPFSRGWSKMWGHLESVSQN